VRILGHFAAAVTLLCVACSGFAAGVGDLSNREAVSGLKAALKQGSEVAVRQLALENGFFGNDRLRIPLPESLRRVEGVMRSVGMGREADELVLRMNRAAEAAMPEAKSLLVDAINKMSLQDAKGILTGGDDSATQYFKRTASVPLANRFLPIVAKAMEHVRLAEQYNQFAKRGVRLGLIKEADANLENYITGKALDGLFLAIAEEERKIRQDPAGAASAIVSKVFGALLR